jgi:K319L-like, PKD domain
MNHKIGRVTRFKAIILGILLLSSFAALSLSQAHVSFAQQNITNTELQQDSNANLSETLARQLGQVFESSSASSLDNLTLPTIGVPSSPNGSQPSNFFPEVDAKAPPVVNQGEIVSLNGSGTHDPDSNHLYYAWSQDGGIPVSINDDDQPVAHFTAPTVSQNSILSFNLLVEDENGAIGKNTTSVTVQATPKPHANAGADQTVDEGEWVTLDGEDSYDPNGDALDYSWTQTSGQGVDLQNSNDPQAHFWAPSTYDDETLKFSLRVQDSEGNSDESSVSVRVNTDVDSNDQPHADAGGDQTVDEGQWVTLDGDGSYDPNGDALDYSWTQTSGQGVDLQDDDEEQAHFRAPSVNDDTSLRFELRVEDQNGRADEDSTTVNVNGINYNSDNLPCVQTYDTAHGTYVTDCNDTGNGNLPILPPCQPGSINPNCKPVTPPCEPGSINPNCKPVTPPCEPGSINPNCKPVTQPLKPNTQPKKIENNPVKENTQPKKIVTQPVKKPAKTQNEPPKNMPTKEHKSQKPPSNPPKPPTQKFKSSGGSGGSKLRR